MTASEISESNKVFLEKVQAKAELNDIFEARDLSEVVFRTMRDLMTTEAADRVSAEFDQKLESSPDQQNEVSELWKDTNPIVAWLSRVRPPLSIDESMFVRRVEQEGGMPLGTDGETVIKAVFSATKEKLSQTRIQEISDCLPGKIKEMWQQA